MATFVLELVQTNILMEAETALQESDDVKDVPKHEEKLKLKL